MGILDRTRSKSLPTGSSDNIRTARKHESQWLTRPFALLDSSHEPRRLQPAEDGNCLSELR